MTLRVRRLLSSASVLVATVVVVVALLVLPGRIARGGASGPDQPPSPTPTPETQVAVGTRNWTAVACPGHALGCRAPTVLNLGGARFQHERSHRQPVQQLDPSTHTLVRVVSPAGGKRWVLIGADGANSSSQLTIKLGDEEAALIPPGTLTMLSVPGTHRSVQVSVADYGRSSAHEVLRIEEYDALD